MNYDDHLARHAAKQKEIELRHSEQASRRQIALEECFKEADAIIATVIQPELEELREALVRHSLPARVTVTREVSELSLDSTFTVGIELREDHGTDMPKRGIVFTAIPHGKFFQVESHTSQDRATRPVGSELKFGDTTPESVQAICARFMELTFRT